MCGHHSAAQRGGHPKGTGDVCRSADEGESPGCYVARMWGRWVARWPGTLGLLRPVLWWDVALAAGVAVFSIIDTVLDSTLGDVAVRLAAAEVAASALLGVRRLRPLVAVTGALGILGAAQILLGHYQSWASLVIALVAVYSAAAHAGNLPYTIAIACAFVVTLGAGEPTGQAAGNIVWTCIALSLPLGMGVTVRRVRAREALALQRVSQFDRERAEQAAAAADAERRRIARELHDIVSHSLGVMVLQAGAAEQAFDRAPDNARAAVQAIRSTGLEAISEMSRLVGLLRDDPSVTTAPQPTLADLGRLLDTVRASGVRVALRTDGLVRSLPAAIELNAYRVVQEGMTNAVKHARGSTVTVTVTCRPDSLSVEVSNDATVVTPTTVAVGATAEDHPGGGFGLAGLSERLAVFGGRLEYGHRAAGGWTLHARFPMPPQETLS